jgi:hypothetical protein
MCTREEHPSSPQKTKACEPYIKREKQKEKFIREKSHEINQELENKHLTDAEKNKLFEEKLKEECLEAGIKPYMTKPRYPLLPYT